MLATPAYATTYYVTKSGSGSACTIGSPCLTIAAGLLKLTVAGDILDIAVGTYTESISNGFTGGSVGNNTVIRGHAGDTVSIKPASGSYVVYLSTTPYTTLQNLTLDGLNITSDVLRLAGTAAHVTVTACTIKANPVTSATNTGNGIFIQDTTANYQTISGCTIQDIDGTGAAGQQHAVYVRSDHNTISGNTIHHIQGYGIHLYRSGSTTAVSNNTVYGNIVYDYNTKTSISAAGILSSSGTNNLIYNNLVYRPSTSTKSTWGIQIDYNGNSTSVYNNTFWQMTTYGIAVGVNSTISGVILRNNIAYQCTTANIQDSGSGTVKSNNLTTNPSFTNAGSADFTLVAGSTAIDAGYDLSATFTTDFLGVTRKNGTTTGSAFDIGAYEYQSPPGTITVLMPNGGENPGRSAKPKQSPGQASAQAQRLKSPPTSTATAATRQPSAPLPQTTAATIG